ncbi:MAG: sigma 54-interacting transcriptional regulator [Planctomycetota bacterium]|nr:sigma 54-interacting transcriptional regulator [Planctomycetota bacterium]
MAKRATRRTIRFEAAINAVESPVFLVDSQRRVVFMNDGCQSLTGWALSEVVGAVCEFKSSGDAASLEALTGALCPPQQTFDGQTGHVVRYFVHRTTGKTISRMVHFHPLGTDDRTDFVIGIVTALSASTQTADTRIITQVHAELAALRHGLRQRYGSDSILTNSSAMRRVIDQVEAARQSRVAVHVCGEKGTGKEHVARVIHYSSDLGQRAFVPIQCRLLPANELREAIRRIVESDWEERLPIAALQPGCVFLNDVDALPRDVQQRMFEFLSSARGAAFRANVRLVSASRCDLDDAHADERLSDEFYYLITSLQIVTTPLRHRMDDLRILAQHFLEQRNRDRSKQATGFSAEVWLQFEEYNWPGNLDELDEVIYEALLNSDGPVIRADHLPFRLRTGLDAQRLGPLTDGPIEALEPLLERVERDQIQRALEQAKGNKTKAARILKITRPNLYRRMETLGLSDSEGTE